MLSQQLEAAAGSADGYDGQDCPLVNAGGADVLAAIAEEKPRLARRSPRASAILGLDK